MAAVYQWKPKSQVAVEAQAAGERLETIRLRNRGSLTPAMVVKDARSEKSPLHPAFEWDDRRAAEKYRLDQASYIIRSIAVVVRNGDSEEPKVTRAFVSVTDEDDERQYTSVSVALTDPVLRAQVLEQATRELAAFEAKYSELEELAPVFEAFAQVMVAA